MPRPPPAPWVKDPYGFTPFFSYDTGWRPVRRAASGPGKPGGPKDPKGPKGPKEPATPPDVITTMAVGEEAAAPPPGGKTTTAMGEEGPGSVPTTTIAKGEEGT